MLITYDTDQDIRHALEAGADGYLLKDTPRDDLVDAVRQLAAGHPVLTPRALSVLSGRGCGTSLTERELEVLREVAAGGTNREAAARLFISEATLKTHLSRVFGKLGVGDRAAAVRVAFDRGLL
ncbi:response regulator transcription factor [Tessaracoccus sp. MC1865]|uniref:response regulator transcription factor n=1 Tax=Tessaracoccus sp. MC1865 TaxID=2760310 RepID=UPI001FD79436|nr:response regulator transcription factor [Tessaracoccus sp. MC1865]